MAKIVAEVVGVPPDKPLPWPPVESPEERDFMEAHPRDPKENNDEHV